MNMSRNASKLAILLASAFCMAATIAFSSGAAHAADEPKMGEKAADFELDVVGGADGEKVKLSETLKNGPAVVVMLRGFPGYQCPLCSRQIARFIRKASELEKAGATVVLVYPGPAENLTKRATEFMTGTKLPAMFKFVVDPGYTMTNAYGLRWDKPRETAYPSTLVVDGDSTFQFVKISRSHGDRAEIDDVIEAVKAIKKP
jgi:peroxiredoxin